MAALASARLFLNHSMPFPHAFHSFISLLLRNVILIYLNGWNTKQSTISFLICIDCRLLFLGHAYPFQHAEFTPPVWYIYIMPSDTGSSTSLSVPWNSVQAMPKCPENPMDPVSQHYLVYVSLIVIIHQSFKSTSGGQQCTLHPYISLTWFIHLFVSSVEEI